MTAEASGTKSRGDTGAPAAPQPAQPTPAARPGTEPLTPNVPLNESETAGAYIGRHLAHDEAMPMDGDCGMHAILYSLNQQGESGQLSVDQVRDKITAWMSDAKHRDLLPMYDQQHWQERTTRLASGKGIPRGQDSNWRYLSFDDFYAVANIWRRPVVLLDRVLGPKGSFTILPAKFDVTLREGPAPIVFV